MSKKILFNPEFENTFWFWKPKFELVLELLGILIEYDFDEDEIEGMKISLQDTDNESVKKWIGGLHYGKKDVLYIKFAQNLENKEMIYVFISMNKNQKSTVEFIDMIQNNYKKIIKN
jgi:hypothetical protein